MSWHPFKHNILLASKGDGILLWTQGKGEHLERLIDTRDTSSSFEKVSWFPDGKRIVTAACTFGTKWHLDMYGKNGRPLSLKFMLPDHTTVEQLCVVDGNTVIMVMRQVNLQIWGLTLDYFNELKLDWVMDSGEFLVGTDVSELFSGRYLTFTNNRTNTLFIWNAINRDILRERKLPPKNYSKLHRMIIIHEDYELLVGCGDGTFIYNKVSYL